MPANTHSLTISDVAKIAGVSTATVSRVLNGHDTVNAELRQRVEAVVKEMQYVPNAVGRALSRSRNDVWCAVVPDVQNPFFSALVAAFGEYASTSGHAVVLANTAEDAEREASAARAMTAQLVAGVLLATVDGRRSGVTTFERAGIPVVCVDRRIDGFEGNRVFSDNVQIGALAARHLWEQGFRHPCLITGPSGQPSSTGDRERGFLIEWKHLNGSNEPVVVRSDLRGEDPGLARVLGGLVQGGADSFFAANPRLTSSTYAASRALGGRAERSCGLIGVDDDLWASLVSPSVTVIVQPIRLFAEHAARLLLEAQNGQTPNAGVHLVFPGELIVRESTQPNAGVPWHLGD